MNVKKDEQEEQIELRVIESLILFFKIKKLNYWFFKRYKTENRLLKQRIENLEKVTFLFFLLKF